MFFKKKNFMEILVAQSMLNPRIKFVDILDI